MSKHHIKVLLGFIFVILLSIAGCADIDSTSQNTAKPSFTSTSKGTIYDSASKLVWLKDANCLGLLNWNDATTNASTLADGQCGLFDGSHAGDWRLPTIEELSFILAAENRDKTLTDAGFSTFISGTYLTSSTNESQTDYALSVDFSSWNKTQISKTASGYVWPVRSRFIDRGEGTIYDSVNNMTWLKNANCFGAQNWDNAIVKSSSLANGQCGLSDGSVAGTWRLPTTGELSFILDAVYPTNSAHFTSVMNYFYLSSSPYEGITNYVWGVDIGRGIKGNNSKDYLGYVWPVHSGP